MGRTPAKALSKIRSYDYDSLYGEEYKTDEV
jgi:hypothetical protein